MLISDVTDSVVPAPAAPADATSAPEILTAPNIIVAPDLPPSPPDFVHLHVHTDYSLLDGCAHIDKLMERAAKYGQKALAITDHGNLYGLFDFWSNAKGAHLKPLLGCEIYLVFDYANTERPDRAHEKRYHMGILAKNETGYKNLVKLVSDAHLHGKFYGKERTDITHLAQHAEGLIGFSGCIQGVIPQALLVDDWGRAQSALNRFLDIFGPENFFIEIMDHGIPDQQALIPKLLKIAEQNNLRVICSNDVHYVDVGHVAAHDALLCIQTGAKVNDEKRMKYPAQQFYLKSGDEMFRIFGERPDTLRNTNLVAEMCNFAFKTDVNNYPVYHLTTDQNIILPAYLREVPDASTSVPDANKTAPETSSEPVSSPVAPAVSETPAAAPETNESVADVAPSDSAPSPEAQPAPSSLKIDHILDSYVTLKNKLNTVQNKPADFAIPEEKRGHMRANGTYLLGLCKKGLLARYSVDYDDPAAWTDKVSRGPGTASPGELCERIDFELSIIAGTGFIDYFLIVWDFIDWARRHGIPVGPGRGSGAGSLIAYCLKITDIDPIRFNLLFERFLNPERVSAPDFDIDFCMNRREDVVNYVKGKYGVDRVSNIITYGTLGAKMVVRDLARVLDVPFSESNRLAKLIPDDLNITLEKAIKKSSELATEVHNNPVAAKIIEEGQVIEGMVRNVGKHACGMIIADRPLTDIVPVTLLEGSLTTQYSKKPVDKLGLLKMDFLGLRTLTIIDAAVQHIRRRPGLADFDIEKVPLDDPATFSLLNSGKTIAVFQLESEGMQGLCRQFNIATIDEIIALIALYRPGPMQFIKDYVAGKKDPTAVKYVHPLLKEIASDTYGILVYQEQVMQAARTVAGYTLGGADELRRAMGKKDANEMQRHRGIFVAGAAKTHGIDEKAAQEIFAVLEKFAEYGFNKSHSAAYAFLSYRTAYLKANYPVEFMAATLGVEVGNAEKVAFFVEECANIGVNVLGPDINQSNANFTPIPTETAGQSSRSEIFPPPSSTLLLSSPGCIRYGIGAVKGVGEIAAKAIIEERTKNGNYKDLVDFLQRLADISAVNSRVVENLVKTGAFDYTGEDRRHYLDSIEGIKKRAESDKADRASGQTNLFDMFGLGDGSSPNGKSDSDQIIRKSPPVPAAEKLQYEKELLGFYLSGHPMNAYAGLEQAINTLSPGPLDTAAASFSKDIRHPIRLCGVASGIQKKITKGDPAKGTVPRPWAFFTLSTKKDSYSVNLFPDTYAEFAAEVYSGNGKLLLDENQHLLVDAELAYRPDRGEWSIHAHRIAPLAERVPLLVRSILFLLHPSGEADDFLEKLAIALHETSGRTIVHVGLLQSDGRVLQANLPVSLKAYCSPDFYRTFIRHPACAGAVVDTPPPAERERKWGKKR